ncbi:hypothetical protein FRACYDRAFT_250012 [Fragilariopsis cylindrus CCMP1102]|uniref:Uncharacterized protein n=1 Tax=Fragilariopsis cylindrus CCMP1102 TaxID=635003 RepID=A0A1E7EQQ8_9STRA|nr:hypothetical protein FRACYDRAFT_250012 [Fragilariopsis cylindrus CCMP1102]|eukprot:OEU08225.1 hypothetical protein FRACYDRAFT_250012 [Fragilariopsis cylindrus CCMP1102]
MNTITASTQPVLDIKKKPVGNNNTNEFGVVKCCTGCVCINKEEDIIKCLYWQVDNHDKKKHSSCYTSSLLARYNYPHFNPRCLNAPYDQIACTKRCYGRAKKAFNQNPHGNLAWSADGKNGVTDPISSETILVDWLAQEGNYSRYCGNSDGASKAAIAKEIAAKFVAAGIVKQRKVNDIVQKITAFKNNNNNAYEWTQATGSGLEKSGSDFIGAVKKRFKYWDELEPIFGDRASATPISNSDKRSSLQLSSDSSDSDNTNTNDKVLPIDEGTSNSNNNKRRSHKIISTPKKRTNNKNKKAGPTASISSKKGRIGGAGSPIAGIAKVMGNSFVELKKHRRKQNAHRGREIAVQERQVQLQEDSAKFEFKMNQLKAYEDLKKRGYSSDKILRLSPEFKTFVDAESDEDDNLHEDDDYEPKK